MEQILDVQAFTRRGGVEVCFEVMKQLRPRLESAEAFAEQMRRQFDTGYELLGGIEAGAVVGLIGFREPENLLYGRFIYVDDLVVDLAVRHGGLGARLLSAVRALAIDRGCAHLVLDTGLAMPLAQRFYYREGMLAKGMHFVQQLQGK